MKYHSTTFLINKNDEIIYKNMNYAGKEDNVPKPIVPRITLIVFQNSLLFATFSMALPFTTNPSTMLTTTT